MEIKVLGRGCSKCQYTIALVEKMAHGAGRVKRLLPACIDRCIASSACLTKASLLSAAPPVEAIPILVPIALRGAPIVRDPSA